MNKTNIQKLISGKPSEFARRIGCPKSTANHYSDGTRTPPAWVYALILHRLNPKYEFKMKVDNDFQHICSRCKGKKTISVPGDKFTEEYGVRTTLFTSIACPDCDGVGWFD